MKVKKITLAILILLTLKAGYSFSQESSIADLNGFGKDLAVKDLNLKSGIFKMYESQQTKFENTTLIKFELGEDANVLRTVHDSDEKIIATLIDDTMDAGVYNMNYKAAGKITAGVLKYRLEVKGVSGIKNVFEVK